MLAISGGWRIAEEAVVMFGTSNTAGIGVEVDFAFFEASGSRIWPVVNFRAGSARAWPSAVLPVFRIASAEQILCLKPSATEHAAVACTAQALGLVMCIGPARDVTDTVGTARRVWTWRLTAVDALGAVSFFTDVATSTSSFRTVDFAALRVPVGKEGLPTA